MQIIFILLFIFIFVIDGIPLIREKAWKDVTFFSLLVMIGVIFYIMGGLEVSNPINWVNHLLEPIGKAVFKQS